MKTTDVVMGLAGPVVKELGYELSEVEFIKEASGWVLTLYIDSEKGITLDDCEIVSRAVDPILDSADPIEQAYYLCVSSLGIDRPLKTDKDFERNIGKPVFIKLYAPIKGKKEFIGKLVSFTPSEVVIENEKNGQSTFLRKSAALIRPHIEF